MGAFATATSGHGCLRAVEEGACAPHFNALHTYICLRRKRPLCMTVPFEERYRLVR